MAQSKYATDIEEIKTTLARIVPQVECIPALKTVMSDMRVEMAGMATTIKTLHESCPYRADIARGTNNITRVEKLGDEIKELVKTQSGDKLALTKTQADDKLSVVKSIMQILVLLAGAGLGIDKLLSLRIFN